MYQLQNEIVLTNKVFDNKLKTYFKGPSIDLNIDAWHISKLPPAARQLGVNQKIISGRNIGIAQKLICVPKGYIVEVNEGVNYFIPVSAMGHGTAFRCIGQSLCVVVHNSRPNQLEVILVSDWDAILQEQSLMTSLGTLAAFTQWTECQSSDIYQITRYGSGSTLTPFMLHIRVCGVFAGEPIIEVLRSSVDDIFKEIYPWTDLKPLIARSIGDLSTLELIKDTKTKKALSTANFKEIVKSLYSDAKLNAIKQSENWLPISQLSNFQIDHDEVVLQLKKGPLQFSVGISIDEDDFNAGYDHVNAWLYLNVAPSTFLSDYLAIVKDMVEQLNSAIKTTFGDEEQEQTTTQIYLRHERDRLSSAIHALEATPIFQRLVRNQHHTTFEEFVAKEARNEHLRALIVEDWEMYQCTLPEIFKFVSKVFNDCQFKTITVDNLEFIA